MRSVLYQGKPWMDEAFPPTKESLYNEEQDSLSTAEERFYDSIIWSRASQVYPALTMNKNGMFRVDDFSQGEIGHNYILAYLR